MTSIVDSPDPFGDGSLVAKYQLDGDATDLTGKFNGTANNVTYEVGKFGQCMLGNGVNSNVEINLVQEIMKSTFSISCFFKVYSGAAAPDTIVMFQDNSNNHTPLVVLSMNDSNNIEVVIRTNSSDTYTEVVPVTINQWHHAVLVLDNNGGYFYLDSVLVGSKTFTPVFTTNSAGVLSIGSGKQDWIGFYYGYFGGEVDQVEVYNRALTEVEVGYLFTQTLPHAPDPIVNLLLSLSFITWSNRETKAQANPQPEQLVTLDANAPIATTVVKNNPFYNDVVLDQQGNQRQFGYIASTTQVSGIPVGNKRVLLFSNDTGLLIDETVSDAQGNYRFDSLLLSKKYMITAQYGNADENTPPDYSATSVDWQSPTPYIEEV